MSDLDAKSPPRGLGDTIAQIAEATGMDKVAEKIAHTLGKEDCGCKGRQEALNKLFPYRTHDADPSPSQGQQEAQEEGEKVTPPHPFQVLMGMLHDPESVERVYEFCRKVHPPFPQMSSSLVLCRFLFLAGMAIPYAPMIEGQVAILQQFGSKVLPATEKPEIGDIYISVLEGRMERIGFVLGLEDDAFWAADNMMPDHKPYLRNIGTGDYPPVLYWLRPSDGSQ